MGNIFPKGQAFPFFSKENAMFDINFIRYDADHRQRIVVDYQDHRDDTVEETAKAFGLRVLTCNHAVADIFGVDVEADENVLPGSHQNR